MHKIVLMTFAGTFGGLACGYNFGVVAPVMLYMDQIYPGITAISKAVRLFSLISHFFRNLLAMLF